jgi:hypothetical protein
VETSTAANPAPAGIDSHARMVDRTHDMVAVHATRLVNAGLDSLQVVIKPGAGMQLSLELRQHGNSVEAQAVLQQGDFNRLNEHWPELQQRLEQRGIRLAPLTGENTASSGDTSNFNHQPRPDRSRMDDLETTTFVGSSLAGVPLPAMSTTNPSPATRNWESWA